MDDHRILLLFAPARHLQYIKLQARLYARALAPENQLTGVHLQPAAG